MSFEEQKPLTSHEKRELKKQQREQERTTQQEQNKKSRAKKHATRYALAALIIIGVGVWAVRALNAPGPYDDFAKCLTENGAVMYGAMDWCKYTQEQAAMFGKSFKHVNYKEYTERPDIKITPTWIINGKKYERVQSFQKLAELTGCEL